MSRAIQSYKNASKAVAEWINDSDVRIEQLEKRVKKLEELCQSENFGSYSGHH